jgi:hypothetical protein
MVATKGQWTLATAITGSLKITGDLMLFRSPDTAVGAKAITGDRRIVVNSMLWIGKLRIEKRFQDWS